MGAPSMVGAKLRINAYNKKNNLQKLFNKQYNTFNKRINYLKNKFTINLNKSTRNFQPQNLISQTHYTILKQLTHIKKEKIHNKTRGIIEKLTKRPSHTHHKIQKTTQINIKTHNNTKNTPIHLYKYKTHNGNINQTENRKHINKTLFVNNRNGIILHTSHNSHIDLTKSNTQIKNTNLFKTGDSKNINKNFIYSYNNNKNTITKGITERRHTKTNLSNTPRKSLNKLIDNGSLPPSHNIEDELNNIQKNSINKTDFHEIMNFVESEINQSLRSPPSGSLMSWVQSVPSYPGLHI
ncbi:hypothetical protein [Acetobacter sp. UBA5411]|uniref:hypothetical protein n=1 Tax=Acetobacter sp. UBA5411 TaxID=1945905 RepID=UPI0025C5067E|nr:hypothetical protein [Acetobacter sp. UBA5411]